MTQKKTVEEPDNWLDDLRAELGVEAEDPKAKKGKGKRKATAAAAFTATPSEGEASGKLADDYYLNVAMAERFAQTVVSTHRFVLERGEWITYNEALGTWEETPEGLVNDNIREWLEGEYLKAFDHKDHRIVERAKVCRQRTTIEAVTKTAREILAIRSDELDRHAELLVVENGVVDLATGELNVFQKDLMVTKRVPYPYVEGATHWVFDKVLEAIPEDVHDWLQVMAGQSLTGYQPSDPICIFMYGGGQNAKSSFIDIMEASAGTYGGTPPQSSLMRNKGGSDDFNLITYRGIRQALVEELPEGRHLDVGAIKRLVGTTKMTARKLHKNYETFDVEATVWVTFNSFPSVAETDWGTWRRLVAVPFPYTFRKAAADCVSPMDKVADPRVKPLAATDREAITACLAWRIAGAKKWFEAKKVEPSLPPSVYETTETWRYRSDSILGWTSENLVFDAKSFCLTEDLLDDFNQWSIRNGSTWGLKTLLERFTNHEVFKKNMLEYKRGRHSKLTFSKWTDPKNSFASPRKASDVCTYVSGVRFRTVADDTIVPDDAEALYDPDLPDAQVDEFDFLDDGEVDF